MATIFLRHPVADYDRWRPHYDQDAPRRRAAGLTEVGVYRDAEDPNVVLVAWTAEDPSGFKAMLQDDGLREQMQVAGVTGPPESWIVV